MYRYELSSLQGHSKVNPWCTGADLAMGGHAPPPSDKGLIGNYELSWIIMNYHAQLMLTKASLQFPPHPVPSVPVSSEAPLHWWKKKL